MALKIYVEYGGRNLIFCDNFEEGGRLTMQKTGDAASARSEEMLSTRLETGDNCRTVKHNQQKGHCDPAIIESLGWVS